MSVVGGIVPDSYSIEPWEDPLDRAAIYTIRLVFADATYSDHQVLCLGLEPVFEEAEKHFLACHNTPDVILDYLLITNQEGALMAKWDGVALSH